jgi:hypothetical protein
MLRNSRGSCFRLRFHIVSIYLFAARFIGESRLLDPLQEHFGNNPPDYG